ncbi:MAG TPA: RCC1 domain-containing protein [Candidatus Wunengus sp. YC63]|uniref:RCC1 domain-containing protein n=1 Tax=Candidatus Wunengus sp. YC63 TaxID=3367699 RepID=UPI00402860E4
MVAAGGFHSLYLTEEGKIWAWGDNSKGQLGLGNTKSTNTPTELTIETSFGIITAGASHSLAIDADGNVYAWGDYSKEQLGTGTTTINTPTPIKIDELTEIKAVDAGEGHSLALDEDGNIWVWGSNSAGQLGNGTTTASNKPVRPEVEDGVTFSAIAAGGLHSVALASDNSIWTWGSNKVGQLGTTTASTSSSKPIKLEVKDEGKEVAFTAIAAGRLHTLALDSGGFVWAWGEGESGQLGQGNTADKKSPTKIKGIENVKMITAGDDHNVALDNDGKLWSWGKNTSGQLGLGSPFSYTKPQEIKGLQDVEYISAGGLHSLALSEDGKVYGWGSNKKGQLGTGDKKDRNKPEEINIEVTTCEPDDMRVEKDGEEVEEIKLNLTSAKSAEVTVTLTSESDCAFEGKTIKATVNKTGKSKVTVDTPKETDEEGTATFTIEAIKAGKATVTFSYEDIKKSVKVTVK